MKVKKSIWIAGIGAVVLLAGVLLPTLAYRAQDEKPVADIEIAATEVTLERNGAEAFSNVAPLTAEEHQQLFEELHALRLEMARKKVLVPGPAEAIAPTAIPETSPAAPGEALPAPSALYIGTNMVFTPVGRGASTHAEPAVANSGAKWFGTQNWTRGYSNNAGATWTTIANDSGPPDAPYFCCDQDAIHDHGRDATIWTEVFLDSKSITGVVRFHVRNANNLSDSCTYDLNTSGTRYDYPKLGVGNNFVYLSTNTLTGGTSWAGAQMWRYNLDQMATCASSLSGSVFTWTGSVGQVVFTPAKNTTDTMYMVTIEHSNQNRYFWWPENSGTVSSKVLTVESSNFGAATCKGGISGSNWLGDPLSTSSVGYQVFSAVGHDNGGGGKAPGSTDTEYLATYYTVADNGTARPQAYAAGTIVRTSDMTVLNFADIWNSTSCFGYPRVAANSRGDLGLSIGFGSSKTGGGPVQGYVGISDDYSRSGIRGHFGGVSLVATGNDNPNRYGDYLSISAQEPVDVAFIAATFGDNSGKPNTRFVELLRGRYAQAYLDRRLK